MVCFMHNITRELLYQALDYYVSVSIKRGVTHVYLLHLQVKEQEKKFPELYSSIFRSIGLLTESLKAALLKTTTTTTSTSITDSPTTTTTTTTRITTTCDSDVIGDIERLVDMNQSLLECIGVGHPDITRILNVCSEHNLHGKLTGESGHLFSSKNLS